MNRSRLDHTYEVYGASAEDFLEHIIGSGPIENSTNILDLDKVVVNVYHWKATHPGLIPFYTPCVNNNPLVLAVLAKLDVGFSCASRKEMNDLLDMGITVDRMWLAHPSKTQDTILYAKQNGILRIACDNVQDVANVHRLYSAAEIVLRIRVSSEQKFGCCPTFDVPEILNLALSSKVNIVGVHIAIPQEQPEETLAWLRQSLQKAEEAIAYAHQLGLGDLQQLVLSGIEKIPQSRLCSILKTITIPVSLSIIIETGREFVQNAVTLVTNVQSKRVIYHGGLSNIIQEIMYFLNDGRYGSFEWWEAIDKPPSIRLMNETHRSSVVSWPTSLWGPTCDSADVICERLELPALEIGDFLIFSDMGAFGVTVASRFNGFPIPKTVACARLESTRAMIGCNTVNVELNQTSQS
ncbi:ornithine decarboxylase 1-like [Anopheles ziemanni]|uniref:ornithine decarboxylase 1-like n=1 Tax=Anopheles coustani TaxID=139045 RepID=UPI00265AA89D|nr:ornithine decarboxylase 1-like [Anopheles coustani]XP_058170693.1 ornithine decarboxylase 1-like [Anopheles ziemanni]